MEESSSLESITGSRETCARAWEAQVRAHFQDRCSSCRGVDRLRVGRLVEDGELSLSNSFLLCRRCEFSRARNEREAQLADRFSVNFWTSQRLHDALKRMTEPPLSFSSVGAIVRFCMKTFEGSPERFDDLGLYQDNGVNEVKVNVWVDRDLYSRFQKSAQDRDLTVSEAVRALVHFYEVSTTSI